jgi:hypothetical protein
MVISHLHQNRQFPCGLNQMPDHFRKRPAQARFVTTARLYSLLKYSDELWK